MTTKRKKDLHKNVLQPDKIKEITTQQFLEALSHDKKYFRTFGGNSPDYNGGRNYGPYSHDEVDYFLKPFNEQEHRDCFVIVNDGGHR